MTKKIMPLVVFLFLVLMAVVVKGETMFYGGGQVSIPGGDTHSIGVGTNIAIGQQLDEKLIAWFNATASKTGEGTSIDNGLVGFSLLTDKFFGFGGLYLNLEGGLGKLEDSGVEFASLVGGGSYFDLSEKTRLWIGLNQSTTEDMGIYSIQTGLSMMIDWK